MSKSVTRPAYGQAIRSARVTANVTQIDLAARIDVEANYLNRLEKSFRTPSLQTLERIAAALGLKLSELVALAECFAGNGDTGSIGDLLAKLYSSSVRKSKERA